TRTSELLRFDELREAPEPRFISRRRLVADERAACVVVLAREERLERNVRVAVESVAVGKRELGTLDHDVNELSLVERADVESLEEGKLLQRHRACTPRPHLADRRPAVVERDHRLERGAPGSEVFAREEP